MSKRTCTFCGAVYTPSWSGQRFCTIRCGQLGRPKSEKDCANCGTRFVAKSSRAKYCSVCSPRKNDGAKSSGLQPTIVCQHCGKVATVTKRSVQFCTQECYQNARTALTRERRLPVLHPEPSLVTWLPDRHPARRPASRRTDWWKFFVVGPCAWCSEPFVARAATFDTRSKYCSDGCSKKAGRCRRGKFEIPRRRRLAIYERDGWRCQLCGRKVNPRWKVPHPRAAVLDHIVPRSLGGSDEDANLQTAHFRCNSVKAAQVLGAGEQLRMIG